MDISLLQRSRHNAPECSWVWLTLHMVKSCMSLFWESFFFPKRRCGRIKNGCVYGKKACDCDFAILNFYCHRGIPENCFVEKSLSPRYCLYCRPRTNRNDNDSNKDPLTALSYLKKWTIISTALDFFRCTVDANVRSLFSEQARISPHNIDTLASR